MGTHNHKPFTIGTLAREAGVGIDTVRFYERRGLLPAPDRTASGYRVYRPETIERIRFVRRAKQLGFTLDEIESLLVLQDKGGAKSEVRAMTQRKLAQIERKIDDLTRMRAVLQDLSQRCSGKGSVSNCPIIEAIGHADDIGEDDA